MYDNEREFAVLIPDYSLCNERFPERYDFPVKNTYGERVFETIKARQEEAKKEIFDLGYISVIPFGDGTLLADIKDFDDKGSGSVRGKKVTIIHPPYITDDRYSMLGQKMADAVFRADADPDQIVLVELYNGNYRQDRRAGRESLNAHVVAEGYKANHVNHIIAYDAHFKQIEALFHKFDNFPLSGWLAVYLYKQLQAGRYDLDLGELVVAVPEVYEVQPDGRKLTVVAPDFGAAQRAEDIANLFGLKMVQIQKERNPKTGEIRIVSVLGDVKDKDTLIVEDVISRGGTVVDTTKACRKRGSRRCYSLATHFELLGNAIERLIEEDIRAIGSDTFQHEFTPEQLEYFDVMDTSGITGTLIYLRAMKKSISRFFDWTKKENWEIMKLRPLYSDV